MKKVYGIIRICVFLALAALVLVFADTIAEIGCLKYFIGGLLMFYGVEEILLYSVFHRDEFSLAKFYWNIIEFIIGAVIAIFVKTDEIATAYAIVCVGWAIWAILREQGELVEATHDLKENRTTAHIVVDILNIIESLTAIVFSLMMMIEPGEHHAKTHLYLLAVELSARALLPMIIYIADRAPEPAPTAEQIAMPEAAATVTDDAGDAGE